MNPDRFAEDRDFASEIVGQGMSRNVFARVFEIQRHLEQIQESVEQLKAFQDRYDEGQMTREVASGALFGVKQLMRSLDSIEYAFPELGEKVWFSGFQEDVHHTFWRVEDERFDAALNFEGEDLGGLYREVSNILDNISDSNHTSPINQLQRFLERYGDEFNTYDAPDEYHKEVFEARDLFCLGYYSTGLIVLGRAVERAILQLGNARKIKSVNGFSPHTDWDSARFWERAEALYNLDMPDDSGKMISKRQYHLIQLLIDYRNKVAHKDYREISKNDAARMMGQALDLLAELEETREKLNKMADDEIHKRDNVSVSV